MRRRGTARGLKGKTEQTLDNWQIARPGKIERGRGHFALASAEHYIPGMCPFAHYAHYAVLGIKLVSRWIPGHN